MLRTHTCGELTIKEVGQRVRLAGWVNNYRNLGGLLFVDLRDKYGLTQLAFSPEQAELLAQAAKLRHEWVVAAEGEVVKRPAAMINKNMASGAIEIAVDKLEVLSQAAELPFPLNNEDIVAQTDEGLRLKYRFLDLRRPPLQALLALKARFIQHIRAYFIQEGFVEVLTPILANSSPEGARDFLVPSRLQPGKFYALPQAPQQFKQLLMVAGVDKYFQIAPCFRDEDTRADRHYGEFYQADMEMSFAEQGDIFAVMEPLLLELTARFSAKKILPIDGHNFIQIPWRQSLDKYGTDKPDLRYDLALVNVNTWAASVNFPIFHDALASGGVVKALPIKGGASLSRKDLDELADKVKGRKLALAYVGWSGDNEVKTSLSKYFTGDQADKLKTELALDNGDLVLLVAGEWRSACEALGATRVAVAAKLKLADPSLAAWCWIVDYPLYEMSELEPGRLDFGHNPFSMPQGGLPALRNQQPLDILAYQYDLVLNGFEISSGAVRNHDPEIMYAAFAVAGYSKEEVDHRFGAMIRAFQFGAPPHAGNAPGIDRLLMVLRDLDSIRDIYAFPKDGQGRDALMDSPSEVNEQQLKDLHIKLD